MIKEQIKKELIEEYLNTTCSLNYLEKKYKISRNTIAKYLKQKGIPTKYWKASLIDEKEVINKYVIERLRPYEIAEIFHCSTHPINNILIKFGVKRKQSDSLKGQLVGDKNPNWRGGVTKYDEYKSSIKGFKYKMRIWSSNILERDNILCKMCGCDDNLEAHHIIPVRELNIEDLFNIKNGITLCRKCHMKIHLHENEYVEQFRELISGSV